jgi:hypothetical protein
VGGIDSPDARVLNDEVGGGLGLREEADGAGENDDEMFGATIHFILRFVASSSADTVDVSALPI